MEKITMYPLVSLFIQFSAIEIRLAFSEAKFMIHCLITWTMTEKKVQVLVPVGEL